MKTAIIIPARYASTRFPGKPLVQLGGQSMLSRVAAIAHAAAEKLKNVTVAVATEDERIADHCKEIGIECVMTSAHCKTGSDRVLEAAQQMGGHFDFVLGLQGDAPFTPVAAPLKIVETFIGAPDSEVITPVVRLRWDELDALRESKKTTPFSGTTCVIDPKGRALWFSKNILPAIRKEDDLRKRDKFSPVYQHIGLYGFRFDILKKFVTLSEGHYEKLEGLEQLRLLENGIAIQTVAIDVDAGMAQAGIDSPEDVKRAEALLKTGTAR
ncbi:MAG: 3-deoxy-manno-octulosonate cytidylyltransferase [Micavibrio sp.]